MTHWELRRYMEYYLKELKPHELKALTERNAFRGGFGNFMGSHSRTKHHLHQAFVEGSSSQDDGNRSRFWEGRNVRNMPKPSDFRVWGDSKRDGSQGIRQQRKIGKGPRPYWVCSSDVHSMYTCPHQKRGSACKVCGSEAHLTKNCQQRYFSTVEEVRRDAERGRNREEESQIMATQASAKGSHKKGSRGRQN